MAFLTDETIMPDGRPLFAWRNELEYLRSGDKRVEDKTKELNKMMELCNIAKIECEKDPTTNDIVVRFQMRDFVKSSNPDLTKIYRKHTQIKP